MTASSPVSAGLSPFSLPAATYSYLQRSASSLREAITSSDAASRYAHAHVAALRATAALLAARATPSGGGSRGRSAQRNAWVLLADVAPELSEWAAFFSAGAGKRAAAEAGARRAVTEREADDLVRDADRFLGLVEQSLGLTRHVPFQELLPTTPYPVAVPAADAGAGAGGEPGERRRRVA